MKSDLSEIFLYVYNENNAREGIKFNIHMENNRKGAAPSAEPKRLNGCRNDND